MYICQVHMKNVKIMNCKHVLIKKLTDAQWTIIENLERQKHENNYKSIVIDI